MDGFFNEQKVKTLRGRTQTQALIQGEIPFPDGVVLKKLLDCKGEVELTSISCVENAVKLEGKIKLDIVCEDAQNKLISFTSWAGLEHEIAEEFIQSGNEASVQALIQNLDTHLKEDVIALNAIVDLDCTVTSADGIKCNDDIQKNEDTEVKSEFFTYSNSFKIGGESFRIRDELKIKNVSEIVCISGYCAMDDINKDGTQVEAEGNIHTHILYVDKNGEYGLWHHEFEFKQLIETSGVYEDIFFRCSIKELKARVIGEEFELAAIEAQIQVEIFAVEENRLSLPVDAYSTKTAFECEVEKMNLMLNKKRFTLFETFKETVNISEGMDDATQLLWSDASVNSINSTVVDGEITIEGILNLKAVYICNNGMFHMLTEDVPYRIQKRLEVSDGKTASVEILYADAVGNLESDGRSFEISFNLMLDIQLYDVCNVGVISKICECEKKDVKHGIIIYSPGENETLFDIGKRFGVSCKSLLEADENITDKIKEGKKIVLFI